MNVKETTSKISAFVKSHSDEIIYVTVGLAVSAAYIAALGFAAKEIEEQQAAEEKKRQEFLDMYADARAFRLQQSNR